MENKDRKKKIRADILLIAGLLLLALGLFAYQRLSRETGAMAVVYVNGERRAAYPLSKDCEVRLSAWQGDGYNVLCIRDGCASVREASCPDKICVNSHAVRYGGESITCLPNRVVVRIEGETSGQGVDIG